MVAGWSGLLCQSARKGSALRHLRGESSPWKSRPKNDPLVYSTRNSEKSLEKRAIWPYGRVDRETDHFRAVVYSSMRGPRGLWFRNKILKFFIFSSLQPPAPGGGVQGGGGWGRACTGTAQTRVINPACVTRASAAQPFARKPLYPQGFNPETTRYGIGREPCQGSRARMCLHVRELVPMRASPADMPARTG